MKSIDSIQPTDSPQTTFCPGFVHVVLFWLKPGLGDSEKMRFEQALRRYMDESDFAVTGYIGRPAGTDRPVVDNSYDYSLIVSFDSAEQHQAYQDEAPHERFREVASELSERVVIYDSLGIGLAP